MKVVVEGQGTTGGIRAKVMRLISELGASIAEDNYRLVLDYCMAA